MKFDEALERFQMEITKEYGLDNAIVKIGITPELMNSVVSDLYRNSSYIQFSPSNFGEFILYGVQLLPRQKDKF